MAQVWIGFNNDMSCYVLARPWLPGRQGCNDVLPRSRPRPGSLIPLSVVGGNDTLARDLMCGVNLGTDAAKLTTVSLSC